MPTLNWIGKEKVINHHNEVPYRVLDKKYTFDAEGMHIDKSVSSENMIIHGDNLEALKSLLPKYEGKIKCIYIDPPYNTGNEGWIYNDNVNDPRIQKWLGEVVGKEGEDLSRHDKWLCMMYPRLKLLQKLLHPEGAMAISIGFHEMHNLVAVCKEIFSARQVVTVTVQTSGGKPSGGFNYLHEYIVFIVPNDFNANILEWCGGKQRTPFEGLTLSTFDKIQRPNQVYPIYINNEDGSFAGVGKSLQDLIDSGEYLGEKGDFEYDYSVAPEGTTAIWPVTSKGKECVWRQISSRLHKDWEKGYIKISKNKNESSKNKYSIQYLPSGVIKKIQNGELQVTGHEEGVPTLTFGINETVGGQVPTIWAEKSFYTVNGTNLLKGLFPERQKVFDYPKSIDLIKSVILALSDEDDYVLDSFAGSGTTGHAILKINNEYDTNRKFILIEMGDYANNLTAERIKRISNDYQVGKETIEGIRSDFTYYELGNALFDNEGNINKAIDCKIIKEYIWFMETRTNINDNNLQSDLLGVNNGTAYYFIFDNSKATVLDRTYLSTIREKQDAYVIYADTCAISNQDLAKLNITFKKIPRDISKL